MSLLLISATTEHFLVLCAFFFPPVLFIVLLVIILATCGKSLGLRERYVSILIRIFEWGAGEIRQEQKEHKKSNETRFHLGPTTSSSSEDDTGLGEYCSLDALSTRTVADSGLATGSPLTRSANSLSMASLRKCSSARNSSSTSLCSASSIKRRHGSGQSIIIRATSIHLDEDAHQLPTPVNSRGWQGIKDSLYFVKAGVEAIIEDEVTSRFKAEQLASWNMLTRTSINFYQFINWKLTILWGLGFLFRYFFLLPMRLIVFGVALITLVLGTAVVGLFPNCAVKRWLNEWLMMVCERIGSRAFSALIFFHDRHNKGKRGICVANHTSPIDVMILGTDQAYALIGQRHPGFLGVIQRALSRASNHIWFERSEAKDRSLVQKRLFEHVQDPHNCPVLIFPEGTCINNTSVMMFKKGCFEIDVPIYPIAMKYDTRFGDAFWNSSEQSYFQYMMQMMTSWALICDVWYLPPMMREEHESAIDFANRVKRKIAEQGGLVDLEWDGQLKRSKVPARLVDQQRERYYQRYQRYTSFSEPQAGPEPGDEWSGSQADDEEGDGGGMGDETSRTLRLENDDTRDESVLRKEDRTLVRSEAEENSDADDEDPRRKKKFS